MVGGDDAERVLGRGEAGSQPDGTVQLHCLVQRLLRLALVVPVVDAAACARPSSAQHPCAPTALPGPPVAPPAPSSCPLFATPTPSLPPFTSLLQCPHPPFSLYTPHCLPFSISVPPPCALSPPFLHPPLLSLSPLAPPLPSLFLYSLLCILLTLLIPLWTPALPPPSPLLPTFNQQEKAPGVFLEHPDSHGHHLSEGRVRLVVPVQLVHHVAGLEET